MNRAGTWQPGHRDVLKLAVPMVISNVSIPLLGMVDTAVVGHLPEPHYLGAVAVGGMIFSFLFWGFGFLRMGTTGFVAQAHGSGSRSRVQQRVAQAGLMALVLAATVLLLQQPAKMAGILDGGCHAHGRIGSNELFLDSNLGRSGNLDDLCFWWVHSWAARMQWPRY